MGFDLVKAAYNDIAKDIVKIAYSLEKQRKIITSHIRFGLLSSQLPHTQERL